MVANFAIHNNTNSSRERNQETLRKLAKRVLKNSENKERSTNFIVDSRSQYTTNEYIPAETYIYTISARTCQNDRLKEKLNFLNNQAAIRTHATKNIIANEDDFNVVIDDSKNIFAA